MKFKNLFGDYLLITILAIIALVMLTVRIIYRIKNKEEFVKQSSLILETDRHDDVNKMGLCLIVKKTRG